MTLALVVVVAQTAWLALLLLPPLPERLGRGGSTSMLWSDGTPAFVFLAPDDRLRLELTADDLPTLLGGSGSEPGAWGADGAVDPDFLTSLLRYEDRRFLRHPGVDPLAVLRALRDNLRAGAVVSGASTLTIQLVRVLEPRPRTLRSKVVEALRALQVETRLDKREILAAYLTFAPYGGNVEGLRAASWSMFGHDPVELSAAEIATLLAVPQSPLARVPSPANAERLRAARDGIGAWLAERGLPTDTRPPTVAGGPPGTPVAGRDPVPSVTGVEGPATAANTLDSIVRSPVPAGLRPLPREAPHAAFWLRSTGAHGPGPVLPSTLDRGLQGVAERTLRSARPGLRRLGIHNGAVVLVENDTRAVRALVGNFDFWDDVRSGQTPGFAVPRSTGSALKPLIYALAVDRGLALPDHLAVDAPVRYGDYAPDNYDGSFVGLIPLEEALSLSLNIPFVRLLSRVGMEPFLGALRAMGAGSLVEEEGWYGLSAAIGALELTPLEMARVTAMFANAGVDAPLRIDARVAPGPARTVVGPASAFLVRRALSRRDRPDFPGRVDLGRAPGIAWKTGTSYGHRDAWAVGWNRRYTAVVWLGNFDASSAFDLVGADAAGPILFDLLEAVEGGAPVAREAAAEPWPGDLQTVEVCSWSGHLPTAACPGRRTVLAPRRAVASRPCPLHVALDVDLDTGRAVLPGCREGRRVERRSFRDWPDEVRALHAERGAALPELPELDPACAGRTVGRAAAGGRARLVSPAPGVVLVLLPGVDPSDQEVPLRVADAEGSVDWFVDGRHLGSSPEGGELWWLPVPGDHEVSAVLEDGRTLSHRFQVRERGASRTGTGGLPEAQR